TFESTQKRIPGGYRRLLQRPSNYNWGLQALAAAPLQLQLVRRFFVSPSHSPWEALCEALLSRLKSASQGATGACCSAPPTTTGEAILCLTLSLSLGGTLCFLRHTSSPTPPPAPTSITLSLPASPTLSPLPSQVIPPLFPSPPHSPTLVTGECWLTGAPHNDAPAVVEAAHVYYGFKQPGYKGALKQAQRGEEKAGVAAGGAALSGVDAATGEAGAGGEAAGAVPAVVVLASSDGVWLGRDELERLGIGEGPIGALVEGGDGEEGGPERGEAEAGAATEDGEKAEGIVESEMENGNEDGGDEKEKVKQGEKDAGAGSGEGKEQAAGRRGERGVEGAAQEGVRVALQVEFTLPASGYATMAIRELLKASTAVSASSLPCYMMHF
ncbi:unnamed protein product, partial [Closterium sp. Naga37s-1]